MKAKGSWLLICRRFIPNEVRHSLGGIILPNNPNEDEYFEGTIHSVGEYCEDIKLNKGDYVLVRNAGNKIKVASTKAGEIYAMEYDDVLCVVDDQDDSIV